MSELFDLASLVETIRIDDTLAKRRNLIPTMQIFKYLIIVDFEATCWEKKTEKYKMPEIIEFPGVLINLESGEVKSEFQQYVTPIESPRLSKFCTELTGITQEQIDNGVNIQTALLLFNGWLKNIISEHKLILPKSSSNNLTGNCAFVTWSDWDFAVCLKKECTRKQIRKPPYFDQWIDLKKIYREFYKYKPSNFNDALTYLNLSFVGEEHCGLHDARNIAKLSFRMTQDGATINLTKDMKPFQLLNKAY